MTRAATTLAGPCTGAPRRDFLLGLRHGQLVGAHVPSWCSGHGVDAGCSQRAGPPGQLTSRSYQTPAEGTGMDWHSSGITTSVIGALKRGLTPLAAELGIHVCGGRGKHSRQTPHELVAIGDRVGIDGAALATASRLVAKVDSAAVQDGFDLYLHGFVVTDAGQWVVIQQGMNGERQQARRYHWLSKGLKSFVDEPHTAIDGVGQG